MLKYNLLNNLVWGTLVMRYNYNVKKDFGIVLFLISDILLCFLSFILAMLLRYSVGSFLDIFKSLFPYVAISMGVFVLALFIVGAYKTVWKYCNEMDGLKLFLACFTAVIVNVLICVIFYFEFLKVSVYSNVLTLSFIVALRLAVRITFKVLNRSKVNPLSKNLLIIGAGSLAVLLINDIELNINLNYNVVGLIDDDKNKLHQRIHGVEVLGTRDDIEEIVSAKKVQEIILAISEITANEKAKILQICSKACKTVKIIESVDSALKTNDAVLKSARPIKIEDLLGRDPIKLDNELISSEVEGKVVLVTGGGGSIGSEICRQLLKFKPKTLVILDIYENTTYELQNELTEDYPEQDIVVLIASVRDKERLDEIFDRYKPELVFHAAAHKHVPLMEYSPGEAIKNNVFGTYNTALCAERHGVKRFTMISTDKAVNPTNVMGASKRMCEMIIQSLSKNSKTEFVLVRFGNVLGSNGSVIPRFKKQIENGGPVTVTHPEITRFFMMIPEAAQLVLQAAAYAKGGEIFVLDMGSPVKIVDLARRMIELSGFVPDKDIQIVFTGLRKGEKLYEELLMNEEGLQKTRHDKIFVAKPMNITKEELDKKLQLLQDAEYGDVNAIKRAVAEAVPTYKAEFEKNNNA